MVTLGANSAQIGASEFHNATVVNYSNVHCNLINFKANHDANLCN